jgi:hypothetical protein
MHSRRRWLGWCLVALLCPLLWGMGVGESQGPTSIPEPRQDFRAAVTDVEGVRVELSQVSLDGQTFVLGRRGAGQVAVPLDRVASLRLSQKDGRLTARLELKQGAPVELVVEPETPLTGRTSYGNFRIPLGRVAEIELLGRGS